MADREKIMWSLARCSCGVPDACSDCHYNSYPPRICVQHLTSDALALLKEQEQKPISASIVDSDSGLMHWWACGNCQAPINPEDKFCHECGRAVKWE